MDGAHWIKWREL